MLSAILELFVLLITFVVTSSITITACCNQRQRWTRKPKQLDTKGVPTTTLKSGSESSRESVPESKFISKTSDSKNTESIEKSTAKKHPSHQLSTITEVSDKPEEPSENHDIGLRPPAQNGEQKQTSGNKNRNVEIDILLSLKTDPGPKSEVAPEENIIDVDLLYGSMSRQGVVFIPDSPIEIVSIATHNRKDAAEVPEKKASIPAIENDVIEKQKVATTTV